MSFPDFKALMIVKLSRKPGNVSPAMLLKEIVRKLANCVVHLVKDQVRGQY